MGQPRGPGGSSCAACVSCIQQEDYSPDLSSSTSDTFGFVWRAAAAVVAISAISAACAGGPQAPDPIACTAQFVYGLAVTVRDAATGQLVCDAQVIAVSGAYRETLLTFGSSGAGMCSYVGAGERPGVYDISANKAGYTAAAMNGVRVDADVCHVIPVRVVLELKQ
jgi:hypothetical protein